MEAILKLSGKTKQANPSVSNEAGIPRQGITEVWYSFCKSNWTKVNPQDKKQSDSKRLLIGKCEEIIHLQTNCNANIMLTKIVVELTSQDNDLLNKDINASGKEINKT